MRRRSSTPTAPSSTGAAAGLPALVHSTLDGRANQPLPDNVRAYLFAGTQHSPGQFPPRKGAAQQQADNPVQYWWPMRALLVSMTQWVTSGTLPPPSQHPEFKAEGSTIVKGFGREVSGDSRRPVAAHRHPRP